MRRTAIVMTAACLGLAPPGPIRVGQVAPPVVAFTAGGDHDIGGYYGNRYVLLTFWSSEGPAGRRQFEALKKLRRGMAREDRLLIVSVCTDDMEAGYDRWFQLIGKEGKVDYGDRNRPGPFDFHSDHKWVNAIQDSSHFVSSAAYGVEQPPEAFIIGPDRRLRAVRIPVEKLGEAVAEALKGPS